MTSRGRALEMRRRLLLRNVLLPCPEELSPKWIGWDVPNERAEDLKPTYH